MPVVAAEGPLLEHILDLTYPVWHEGLTRRAYGAWNAAQRRTAWGRDRLARMALVDAAGTLLASLKRYRFDVRIDGCDGWACGIGAVHTPPDRRGRGHARELVETVLDDARRDGALVATLFSEIGPGYYERLGFERVAIDEAAVAVHPAAGAPAMLVRAGGDGDVAAVAAMHAARAADARLALRRDSEAVRFALTRKRLFAGLGPPGLRQLEFFVAEEGAAAVAYAVLQVTARGWTLEEGGDRDPSGARLGALLQALVAREPAERPPLIRTWWPRPFPVPPQLTLTDIQPARDAFMVRPLQPGVRVPDPDAVFYWRNDCF